jgi:hypothetical protein
MSEYEIFYSTGDAELKCGWYWRTRCGWASADGSRGTGWVESGPFVTADVARANAEQELEDDPEPSAQ